tara:strand:+ start:1944 stop:2237 length:294 start_codon:yes stop_codon:yes gene_type:complete
MFLNGVLFLFSMYGRVSLYNLRKRIFGNWREHTPSAYLRRYRKRREEGREDIEHLLDVLGVIDEEEVIVPISRREGRLDSLLGKELKFGFRVKFEKK